MRNTSNVQYIKWIVPMQDRDEFDCDEVGYLRKLINTTLRQSRFNRSMLILALTNEDDPLNNVMKDSYGLLKGQGSSDHGSHPILTA